MASHTIEEPPIQRAHVYSHKPGQIVRKSQTEVTPFVRQLLMNLSEAGFCYAPRYLGTDSQGQEILQRPAGEIGVPGNSWSNTQLVAVAALLRAYHDATASMTTRGDSEVICHGAPGPENVILRNGIPYAFIGFDGAHPGSRLSDLAYAAVHWLEIGSQDPNDIRVYDNIELFAYAYGEIHPISLVTAIGRLRPRAAR